jgi:single-stranded-DNA-specific exonuclease
LCGTGVAYKLIVALEASGIKGSVPASALIDFYALATVGDLAPLTGENRYLTRQGLRSMNQDPRPGIRALKEVAGLAAKAINAAHIAMIR